MLELFLDCRSSILKDVLGCCCCCCCCAANAAKEDARLDVGGGGGGGAKMDGGLPKCAGNGKGGKFKLGKRCSEINWFDVFTGVELSAD